MKSQVVRARRGKHRIVVVVATESAARNPIHAARGTGTGMVAQRAGTGTRPARGYLADAQRVLGECGTIHGAVCH